MSNHVQCKIERNKEYDTCWLPEKFGHVGMIIELKKDGEWEGGWMVVEVYDKLPTEMVEKHKNDYRSQRKVSDI